MYFWHCFYNTRYLLLLSSSFYICKIWYCSCVDFFFVPTGIWGLQQVLFIKIVFLNNIIKKYTFIWWICYVNHMYNFKNVFFLIFILNIYWKLLKSLYNRLKINFLNICMLGRKYAIFLLLWNNNFACFSHISRSRQFHKNITFGVYLIIHFFLRIHSAWLSLLIKKPG